MPRPYNVTTLQLARHAAEKPVIIHTIGRYRTRKEQAASLSMSVRQWLYLLKRHGITRYNDAPMDLRVGVADRRRCDVCSGDYCYCGHKQPTRKQQNAAPE